MFEDDMEVRAIKRLDHLVATLTELNPNGEITSWQNMRQTLRQRFTALLQQRPEKLVAPGDADFAAVLKPRGESRR